jgi:cobalt/nickel transport system permease protein
MIEEPFASGNSIIHRIDPRFRVAVAILVSMEAALLKDFRAMAFALAGSLALVFLARLDLFHVLKRLFSLVRFLVFVWLLIPLTYEGQAVYLFGPLAWSREGFLLCAQISLKSLAILLFFMALVSTMGLSTLGKSLKALFVPGKLVHLLLMTYRYIFVIGQEYDRLETAIKIRGFSPTTTLHSYKTYAYLVAMLFVKASIRAERVHQAMILRGFRGRFYSLDTFTPSYRNWIFFIAMMGLFIGTLFLERGSVWPITIPF